MRTVDNDPLHVEYGFNKIFRTTLLHEEFGFMRYVIACEMGLMRFIVTLVHEV